MASEPHKVTLVLTRGTPCIELVCPPGCDECDARDWFHGGALCPEETYDDANCDLSGRTLPVPIKDWTDDEGYHWRVAEETS